MGSANELLTIESAHQIVLQAAAAGSTETVALGDSLGRVLSSSVACDIDYPPFDKAMMDGYAVRSSDFSGSNSSRRFRVVGQIAAGTTEHHVLCPGEAVQINTGAPVPDGADAVVRVEDTELSADGSTVAVNAAITPCQHIGARATCVSAGVNVLDAGTLMGSAQITAAAAAGAHTVSVYNKPRVAILATGDELVPFSELPRGAQIRNCNGIMLRSLVRECGGIAVDLGIAGDDRKLLTDRIRVGLEADVLCVTGGVSVGAFDFVPEVLESCGVRLLFRKVAIKPGKPVLFGIGPSGNLVFGLPGNPISGFMVFRLLVGPALAARQGRPGGLPAEMSVRIVGQCAATAARQSYWPMRVQIDVEGVLRAERLPWAGSGDPFGFSKANAVMVRPAHSPAVETGGVVSVIPLELFRSEQDHRQ